MNKRHSQEEGSEPQLVSEQERAPQEAANAYAQAVRLDEMVDEATSSGRFSLRPSALMELNHFAVKGLVKAPGRYRLKNTKITESRHKPPPPDKVAYWTESLCEHVNSEWESKDALELAAYVLWRVCWIHPFEDGNGRTARAACHLVLCSKLGIALPGTGPTVPSQIYSAGERYYKALEAADQAELAAALDLSELQELLSEAVLTQVNSALRATSCLGAGAGKSGTAGRREDKVESASSGPRSEPTAQRRDWNPVAVIVAGVAAALGAVVAAYIGLYGDEIGRQAQEPGRVAPEEPSAAVTAVPSVDDPDANDAVQAGVAK